MTPSDDRLADYRTIVITGASSGIGAALARRLGGPGRTIALIARDAARLEAVRAAGDAAGAACTAAAIDVRDRTRLADFLDGFDRAHGIDLLIVNAGILDGRHAEQATEDGDTARRVIDINLTAAIDTVHAVLPAMQRRRRGAIVLVSSLAGFVPLADAPAYSAAKAGMVSYALALRDGVEGDGVRVVVACPGFVATPMAALHLGPRPGEISADEAAMRILDGLRRNRAVIGFPTAAFWWSRINLLVPEFLRRRGAARTRFHVASDPTAAPSAHDAGR
ncbi:SDR family NAD(P)-dependent oxidoreductase [Reyranella sp.]|uniref:SDR family NAD(P)-dependent oxidoreductase n=1 Tax=Reyranella sp. TaxID=1929291 RepID=UPI003BAA8EF3